MYRGFSPPQIKVHVEIGVVFLHIRNGDINDLLPQGAKSAVTFLQFVRVGHSLSIILGIFLGLFAGSRVDLLQFRDRKRSLFRVFAFKCGVKIAQVRLSLGYFRDDKTHLKAPVAQMNIADHIFAVISGDPLDGFSDHRAAKMTHMKRFGDIGSAVIQDHGDRLLRHLEPELLMRSHLPQIRGQERFLNLKVQKTGLNSLYGFKYIRIPELRSYIARDHDRCLMVSLGTGHRAVALILTQVRAVGDSHFAQFRVIAGRLKCLFHLFRDQIQKFFHIFLLVYAVVENDYIVWTGECARESLFEKGQPQKFCLYRSNSADSSIDLLKPFFFLKSEGRKGTPNSSPAPAPISLSSAASFKGLMVSVVV